jgi:group I intron endonuclease
MSNRWPEGLLLADCPPQGQCCVYLLRNTVNDMKYVGVSWSLRRRMKDHSKAYGPTRSYIRNAINDYGVKAFELSILHLGERRDCLEREKVFIDEHGSLAPAGYNLCGGGEGAVAGMTGERNHWYGKKFSDEHRAKISAANRGQKRDPEFCEKMRIQRSKQTITLEQREKIRATLTGRELTEEHKAAMSRANKGKKLSPEHVEKTRQALLKRGEERRKAGLAAPKKKRPHKDNSHSRAMQLRWQDPEFRAKMLIVRKTQKKFEGKKPCQDIRAV